MYLNLIKMDNDVLLNILNTFQSVTKKPEKYLSFQEKDADEIKQLSRNLYGFTKRNEKKKKPSPEVLNELVISDFDEEQIWQQIELQNNFICDTLVNDISHLIVKKEKLRFPLKEKHQDLENELSNGKISCDEESENEKPVPKSKENVSAKKNVKTSVVDDQFFKLHEMENFLEKMEKGSQDVDDDDVIIDYFQNDDSESNDSESQPHFNDFFDQPEDGVCAKKRKDSDLDSDFNSDLGTRKNKKVKFDVEEDSEDNEDNEDDEDDDMEGLFDDVGEDDNEDEAFEENGEELENSSDNDSPKSKELNTKKENKTPSTFEARQERLKSRINALEEEALREKPWQLKGEVTANSRPQNSLLQEYVEFDIASRPPPVLTEKSTLKLEDIIMQRIKDKAWDDVVRKIKPVENEIEYKKKLVLDQEKSKLSLAQIYEQEYLKQLESKNEDLLEKHEIEPKEHQEIRIMMNKLFSKLDALSNFHFTPKQVEPEIKIISNVPAITMEEVAPTATSDATLLAPEEVKAKSKGDLIGKSERTSTDKKRERRQKKLKQKLKYKAQENKDKSDPQKEKDSSGSKNKKLSKQLLQKVTKSNTVTQLEENGDGKFIKSSNAFFSKLQDETRSMIKKKGFELNSKNVGKKLNSKKAKSR